MPAISLRPPLPTDAPTASGRGAKATATVAGELPVAGLLAGGVVASTLLNASAEQAAMLGLVGVAVGLTLALVVWRGRRTARRQKARTAESLSWIEGLHVCSAPSGSSAAQAAEQFAQADPEPLSVRVMRLQVRSLEAALEEQHALADETRRAATHKLAETRRLELQRVRLALAALRPVLAQQPGVVAVERIESVLARLGAEVPFARPTLPESTAGLPAVVLASAQPASEPVAQAAPVEPAAPAVEEPAVEEPVVPARVLPVPAPPAPATHHRTRRRRRRTAAA